MKNFYLFVIILAILSLNSCSNRGLPIISRSSPEEKIVSQLKETKKCIKCNLENSNLFDKNRKRHSKFKFVFSYPDKDKSKTLKQT